MHKKLIKKHQFGGYVPGIAPSVYNASMGQTPSTPGYIPTGSTSVNSGIGEIMRSGAIGQAIAQGGSIAGQMIGGEAGNAIGTVAGNLGSNILSAGSISGGLKNFSKFNVKGFGTKGFEGFGNLGNLAGGIATGILDRSASHQRTSGKYGSIAAGTDMIGGLIGSLGNYGGYSVLGSLGMAAANKLTGGTDGMTIADSLLGSSSLAGGLTAINPIAGAAYVGLSALNSATGKTTTKNSYKDFMSREQLDPLWASYSKSFADHKDALKYGGKKYGGLSRLTGQYGKADRKVRNDNSRLNTMMDIADRRELGQIRGEQMADINALDYRLNTFGGYDQYGTRVGRKGMKLPTKQEISKVKSILEYKKGGQMNVIPEGALHARKNHMEGAGKDFTHKGIPVMDKDGEQQAEIERDEIIFSLRVTQKLERLKNDGSDEAAIKAGKLLVDEIFHNTDDRTGLIAEVIGQNTTVLKEGGVLLAQEPEIESEIEVEEPVGIEEVEYYENGGILEEGDNAISAEEPEIYNDDVEEFQKGGNIEQLNNLSPDKLQELENILKYLNQ